MANRGHNRDTELISSYIDGELPPRERQALETRLEQEAALRRELEAMREDVQLLRELPRVRAPRNFTLDPAVYGRAARRGGRWGMWLSAALGAAAALVLALGVLFLAAPDAEQKGMLNVAAELSSTLPADGAAAFDDADDVIEGRDDEQDQDEAAELDLSQASKMTSIAEGTPVSATLAAPPSEELMYAEPAGEPFAAMEMPGEGAATEFGGGGDDDDIAPPDVGMQTTDALPQAGDAGVTGDSMPAGGGMGGMGGGGEFIPPGGETVIEVPTETTATSAFDVEAEALSAAGEAQAMTDSQPAPAMAAVSSATPPPLPATPSAAATASATLTPAVGEVDETARGVQTAVGQGWLAATPTLPAASDHHDGELAEPGEPGDDRDTLGMALLIIGAVMLVAAVWGGLLSVWRRR